MGGHSGRVAGYDHWVTISTIGCKDGEIKAFDSLPPATTSDLKNQVAALLCTTKDAIQVKYMDTQMQSSSNDCGIFAIAFATALANGEHPGAYQFDQPKMRKHLIDCLEAQFTSTFPVKRTRADKYKVLSTFDAVHARNGITLELV